MAANLKQASNDDTVKKEDLWKYVFGLISICVLDISVHYQYIPSQSLNLTSSGNIQNETVGNIYLDFNFSQSAKILFAFSLFRAILLCLSFKICHDNTIPKKLKPYKHHVAMTTSFVFIALTTWRLLLDSEPPKNIFCFAYMFFIAMDLTFVIAEYIMNRSVMNICMPKKSKKSKKKKKKKKKKEPGTVVKFFAMLRKVTKYYTSEWLPMTSAYVLMIIGTSASSIEPFLNSMLIDAIGSDSPRDNLPAPVLWFSLCVIVQNVVRSVRSLLTEQVGRRISFKAKCQLYSNILRQEVAFFDENKSGKILRRLGASADNHMLEQLWSSVEENFNTIFELVTQLIVMLGMSWRLTLIILVGNYLIWLPENILMKFWRKKWNDEDEIETSLSSMSSEAVRNIRTVKSFANEKSEFEKYKEKLEEYQKLTKKSTLFEPVCYNFERATWLLIRGIILFYGAHLIAHEQLTSGTLITFLLYMEQLWATTSYLISQQSRSLFNMMFRMERFFDYLERESKIDTKGKETEDKLKGKLEFKNVSFHYPSRPESNVLKDLSFTVGAGEVVALVGSSGGGKSTCVHLIERFYEPVSGTITLDDKPLAEYDNEFLHRQISLVSQEPVLFGLSIEENIKYGRPDATHEEVVQAAKDANAHDFITALDNGYETDVGEAGSQMSGGQKQRIAIARALITNPKVMLLDEATSALDAESESLVQEALQNSIQGRTVIIIAHRLSTVEHADKIVVINKGTIAEQGTHQDLIAKNGVYCRLVRKQVKGSKLSIEEMMQDEEEIKENTSESLSSQKDKESDKKDEEKEGDSDSSCDSSSDSSSDSSDDSSESSSEDEDGESKDKEDENKS